MTNSAFEAWFVAQHGKRNVGNKTDDQLRDLVKAGHSASRELDEREQWDARFESALYAWQARETA